MKRQRTPSRTQIDETPDEIINLILSRFNRMKHGETLEACMQVCKKWEKLIKSFVLFPDFKDLMIGLGLAKEETFNGDTFKSRMEAYHAYASLHLFFYNILFIGIPNATKEYIRRPEAWSHKQIFERNVGWRDSPKDKGYLYYVVDFKNKPEITIELVFNLRVYTKEIKPKLRKINDHFKFWDLGLLHWREFGPPKSVIVRDIGRVSWFVSDEDASARFDDVAYFDMNDEEFENIKNINYDPDTIYSIWCK
jgi:hypothetical protein